MPHGLSKTKTMRGDRSGLSAVEFTLLLPFFALTVAGDVDVLGPILATRTSGGAEWESAGLATTENAAVRRDVES